MPLGLLFKDLETIEKYNAKFMQAEDFPCQFDLAVMDVSFISQTLIHKALSGVLDEGAIFISLIKPQFEAGKENVGKKGVVRDPKIHQMVLDNFVSLVNSLGFSILGLTFSPVKGPEGNIEFLAHLSLDDVPGIRPDTAVVVQQAHDTLDKGAI